MKITFQLQYHIYSIIQQLKKKEKQGKVFYWRNSCKRFLEESEPKISGIQQSIRNKFRLKSQQT